MRRRFLRSAPLLAVFYAPLSVLLLGGTTRAGTLQTLAITGWAYGGDGFNVVGTAGSFGFLYDGSTYSTIRPPGSTSSEAFDIAGNRIVGTFGDATGRHGFLLDGTTYTTLDNPLAVKGTIASAIDGNNIVGWYLDAKNRPHGFLFDGSTYTTIDNPNGIFGTQLWGISGANLVGTYTDARGGVGGFIYDGATCRTLNDSLGPALAYDIEHSEIVGSIGNPTHGFLYDGATITRPLSGGLPGVNDAQHVFTGISGNRLVGYYTDLPPVSLPHPFIYVIPEPTTRILAASAAVAVALVAACRARVRRRWSLPRSGGGA